ncbi:MAG: hypothetical protein HQL56_14630 [Magnetococcales bacterium]|nr:hypothetical protein [Magnetococcales bacterium]
MTTLKRIPDRQSRNDPLPKERQSGLEAGLGPASPGESEHSPLPCELVRQLEIAEQIMAAERDILRRLAE